MFHAITFRKTYAVLSAILLLIELFIAVFVRDGFVRPYLGDVLVVILLYCFFRTFLKVSVIPIVLSVFTFACLVKLLQYLHFVEYIGLQQSSVARIILGSSFSGLDLFAYAVGTGLIIALEKYFTTQRESLSTSKKS